MAESAKIHFELMQDEDGYPPAAVESVWAEETPQGAEYIVDNVPFFIREATLGDTVRVREEDGNLWFDSVVSHSTNSLIRVVFYDRSTVGEVAQRLEALGCTVEYSVPHNLLAVSVPGHVPLASVQAYLREETDGGKIGYEEAVLKQ